MAKRKTKLGASDRTKVPSPEVPPAAADVPSVDEELVAVKIRKPHRQEYFRAKLGADWERDVMLVELKIEQVHYLVLPEFEQDVGDEGVVRTVTFCQNHK